MSNPTLEEITEVIGRQYLQPFRARVVDTGGGSALFSTDLAKTVAPTQYFSDIMPQVIQSGVINRVKYRLNPTNAVTYTVSIWEGVPPAAGANAYDLDARLLYESPTLQADDTTYDRAELNVPFVLERDNAAGPLFKLYFSIDWTGAPGVTPGYIMISGLGAYV